MAAQNDSPHATGDDGSATFNARIQQAIRNQLLAANAHAEAMQLAWDSKGDLDRLREELLDTEDLFKDPKLTAQSMAPGASPRIYKEAYAHALRKAIEIIGGDVEPAGEVPT